ncbi:hypothetical protein XENTR_v10004753 [Xenopus tropicalis]|nr:hypothetical protein XENTR_v10004753 [Xenopus tropicalis]
MRKIKGAAVQIQSEQQHRVITGYGQLHCVCLAHSRLALKGMTAVYILYLYYTKVLSLLISLLLFVFITDPAASVLM